MELRDLLESRIRDVPDWPKPGVVFKDISPLLADHQVFGALVEALADQCATDGVDKVVGIEARGFILAAPVAFRSGAGFVPVRKQGKLPCATYAESYDLEYGSATLEVHRDAFTAGDRVLVIDDVLATGGTVGATIELVRRAGADIVGVSVLMELGFLGGRAKLASLLADTAVRSFVTI
ncbi:adenine phosphoribosyltransferase [Yinghuangia sp. ASG 101]|uniref:adenine phosphoribosyltransferase n=1 Tax=Yinghuangia sp. ASG 101 TaxID=2896848 RepID=UPI001E34910A|nr:adenine phosphoribosyltransferase [Yinghuangia sp. ASG 101]UGQ10662.1 adenine phosphoribosyltransferase [Yinghuangia sp. ASG 101]